MAARSSTVSVRPAEPEEPTVTLPLDHEPTTPGADILETSIVESGGPLSLNPFPSEEDNEDEPVGGAHYTRSTVEQRQYPRSLQKHISMYQPKMFLPLHQEQELPRKCLERRFLAKIGHDQGQAL